MTSKIEGTDFITPALPPTPVSILLPLPAPPPPLTAFEPLPPPLSPFAVEKSKTFFPHSSADFSDAHKSLPPLFGDYSITQGQRVTPRNLIGERRVSDAPERGYFPPSHTTEAPRLIDTHSLAPPARRTSLSQNYTTVIPASSNIAVSPPTKPIASSESAAAKTTTRKRPRREAALTKPSPEREISPLDGDYGKTTTGPTQNNRKVSHSLIERRRREKINECLANLKQTVPFCREEGQRKEARAKERGRKRGRKVDDEEEGSRGGLHKLEILQGTILYIEELEAKISALEAGRQQDPSPDQSQSQSRSLSPLSPIVSESTGSLAVSPPAAIMAPLSMPVITHPFLASSISSSAVARLSESIYEVSNKLPPIRANYSYSSSSSSSSNLLSSTSQRPEPLLSLGGSEGRHDDEDSAALLLLKFSTSPELRPVFYD